MANAVTLPGERLAGLSADFFHKLQAGALTLDEFALFTQRKNPFKQCKSPLKIATEKDDVFCFAVDYNQTLEQIIIAGCYDWKTEAITSNCFPLTKNGVVGVEARYFHFKRPMFSKYAEEEIEKARWSPAKIEHLVSFGSIFQEEQRKHPIVCLGSDAEVDGSLVVPVLSRDGLRRNLHLSGHGILWEGRCRFLAVRKVSVA